MFPANIIENCFPQQLKNRGLIQIKLEENLKFLKIANFI